MSFCSGQHGSGYGNHYGANNAHYANGAHTHSGNHYDKDSHVHREVSSKCRTLQNIFGVVLETPYLK